MSGWTPLEKTLASLSVLLLLALLLLIALGLSGGGSNDDEQICLTKDCIRTANDILLKMDEGWDPCTNFYEYTCGGLNKTSEPLISRTGQVLKGLLESSLSKQVADLEFATSIYTKCVNFVGLSDGQKKPDDTLRDLMTRFEIGTWPVVDTFFDVDSKLTFDQRLAGLSLLGIPVAYKTQVSLRNGSFLLKLSPGGPQIIGRSPEEIRDDDKLRAHLLSAFHLLGAPYSRAIADAADIISVDMGYATIHQESSCKTVDYLTAQESEKELNRLIPDWDWDVLLSAVKRAAKLNSSFAVELHCREKIRDYMTYLDDLSDRSVYNYIGWRFYSAFEKHIVPELSQSNFRWMDCISLIQQYSSQSLLEALARHHLPDSTLVELQRMTTDIESNFQIHFPAGMNEMRKDAFSRLMNSILHIKDSKKRFFQNSWSDSSNYTAVVISLRRQSVVNELQKLNPTDPHTDFTTTESRNLLLSLLSAEHSSAKWLMYGSVGTFLSKELYNEMFKKVGTKCLEKRESCLWTFLNQTNEENSFVDVCTVELAYESLKKLDTQEKTLLPGIKENHLQMFLIAYAQRFCESGDGRISSKQRLNAFAAQSAVFQEIFHCPSSVAKCSSIVKS